MTNNTENQAQNIHFLATDLTHNSKKSERAKGAEGEKNLPQVLLGRLGDSEGREKDTDAQRRGKLWVLGKQKQEVGGRHERWGTDRHTDRQNKNTIRGEEKIRSSDFLDNDDGDDDYYYYNY